MPVAEGAERGRHRRARGLRPEGRHRARYGLARWVVPAGVAVIILFLITAALLVTDLTTSAVLLGPRR